MSHAGVALRPEPRCFHARDIDGLAANDSTAFWLLFCPCWPKVRLLRPIGRGTPPKKVKLQTMASAFVSRPSVSSPTKSIRLAELIDLAETHNPETRVAWENAKAEAAALGIARSELYPTLAALAQLSVDRVEIPFGSQFYRQTIPAFEVALDLNYTVFDFGARRGRISAEAAKVLAANFAFNDVHRRIIYQVQQAYYRLLNAFGQEAAARASLANAQAVQQAAEERLRQGLATLPDVLEARSATAQTQYELQAVLGAEEVARGDLATALGAPATTHDSGAAAE